MLKIIPALLLTIFLLGQSLSYAGSIFITGHDPIWHSHFISENQVGASNLALTAIDFARDSSSLPFLFVESTTRLEPLGNFHEAPFLIDDLGIAASDFVIADLALLGSFSDFRAELDSYSAIVVAGDHGGMLTSDELSFLNSHSGDVIDYLNSGGGLTAFAESNAAGLIGGTQAYGFLPFLVSSTSFSSVEIGNTVTPFGASLGLTDFDVNGNVSHNFFSETGGMTAVDLRNGNENEPLSLAYRGAITATGIAPIPEPATIILFGTGLTGLMAYGWWRKRG